MDINRMKRIKQRDKNLSFGYIRKAQSLFSNTDKSCYNIPEIISYLVALYLCLVEYFEYHGPDIEISDNKMNVECIQMKYRCFETMLVHGHQRINNKSNWAKYVWKFKINISNSVNKLIQIGLVSSNLKPEQELRSSDLYFIFGIGWTGWFAIGPYSRFKESSCHDLTIPEIKQVQSGDILTLELDVDKKILRLFVNEKQCEYYFKIEMNDDIEFKMVMSLYEGVAIQIKDFEAY